jgi:YihY family inner membrane protein
LGVSGLGYYLGTEQAMQRVLEQVDQYAPPLLAETFRKGIPGVVEARGTLGIVAMLTLFWSASEAFTMLERGVNLMWGAQRRRWWHARLLGAGLVLLTGASALVITSLATLSVWLGQQQIMGHPLTSAERLTKHTAGIAPFLLAVIISSVIYEVLPNTRVDRRAALTGGLVFGALFYLVLVAFRTVLLTARFHLLYGPLAGVVAALFCVYYCNAVLLLGAETAEYVTERYAARERRVHPSEDAPEPA